MFTVDGRRMREKMGGQRFTDPGMWAVLLVTAAMGCGARWISFREAILSLDVLFDGEVPDLSAVAGGVEGDTPRDRPAAALAAALSQLAAQEHVAVEIRTFDGGRSARLVMRGTRVEAGEVATPWLPTAPGTCVSVRTPPGALLPHLDSVRRRCAWAAIDISGVISPQVQLQSTNAWGLLERDPRIPLLRSPLVVRLHAPAGVNRPFFADIERAISVQRAIGNVPILLAWGGELPQDRQAAIVNGQAFDIRQMVGIPDLLCLVRDDDLALDLSFDALVVDEHVHSLVGQIRAEARAMAEELADHLESIPRERLGELQRLLDAVHVNREEVRQFVEDDARRGRLDEARRRIASIRRPTLPPALEQVMSDAAHSGVAWMAAQADSLARQWTANLLRLGDRFTPAQLHAALSAVCTRRQGLPGSTCDVPHEQLRLALLSQAAGLEAQAAGEVEAVQAGLQADDPAAWRLQVRLAEARSLLERARGRRESPPLHEGSDARWQRQVEADLALADGRIEAVVAMGIEAPSVALLDTVVDALRLAHRPQEALARAEQAMREWSARDGADAAGLAERLELLAALGAHRGLVASVQAWWRLRGVRGDLQQANLALVRSLTQNGEAGRADEYLEVGRRLEALLADTQADETHLVDEAEGLRLRLAAIGCGHLPVYGDVLWLQVRALRHARRFQEADCAVARWHLADRLRRSLRAGVGS